MAGIISLLLAGAGTAQEEKVTSLPLFVGTEATDEKAPPTPPAPPEKARALLDELKKSESDRQFAAKQTEIDRLKQDRERTEREAADLQKTIDSTTALVIASDDELSKLATETRRLEHELAVTEARIAAERLRTEGLRALSVAQSKSLSALARHAEETEARTRLRSAELALMREGKSIPTDSREETAQSELGKCRKALALAEAKTLAEERAAQEAIKAAAVKMAAAEARANTAKRLADNDLTLMPVAEKTKPKTPAEKKDSDPVVRKSPVAAATAPKPSATPAARPNSASRGPFFGR